ncbi:hypothetical protein FK220_001695 [Flavobacteriaceae bacterium TP-CH-4]|uniref:Uncharacterized protein n=1 Tax=Pelagihabitans pacificus TaxID=2696054 RepID=A0A967E4Z6_9FLAO|nr:hypothetical protein [Pelagihabitans pacificus]NHF58035.1 hypothetical protein [Pelagihabitans pacificus]
MIKDKLISLCRSLESEKLEEVYIDIGNPIKGYQFSDFEYEYAVTVHDKVKSIYTVFNGLRIKWQFHSKNIETKFDYLEGNIQLLNFRDMMIGYDGRAWKNEIWSDKTEETELKFFQRLKPFDYFGTDTVRCVCLEMTEDRILTPDLWLFNLGHVPLRMEIQIDEYIGLLEKTKGIWGWQYFYTKIDLSDKKNSAIRENCEFIINSYPKVFDDKFENELESLFQKLVSY